MAQSLKYISQEDRYEKTETKAKFFQYRGGGYTAISLATLGVVGVLTYSGEPAIEVASLVGVLGLLFALAARAIPM